MALPKIATSSAFTTSLIGANSFVLGQAAWHYRPMFLRDHPQASKRQRRDLSLSSRYRDSRLEEHRHVPHQDLPPPTRPGVNQGSDAPKGAVKSAPKSKAPSESSGQSPSASSVSSDNLSSQSSTPPAKQSASTAEQARSTSTASSSAPQKSEPEAAPDPDLSNTSLPAGWEDNPDFANITAFSQLPHRLFGYNQHIKINEDFKESLRQILWQFRAPIRYAFAYGSGVFGQQSSGSSSASQDMSPHPNPPKAVEEWQKGGAKIIDFIFGVSHTQHWHSLNLTQHPKHYSAVRFLPYSSAIVSAMQDRWGAGVYFNPYITVNGVMIKYGVVNLDTLATDLSEWSTLYLAGRLQKPVKILRDDPRIRLAQQVNLISALRTALLMLPETFTERELYTRIAGLSYLGDPRMSWNAENPNKVKNIVGAQLPGFRQLYVPLIQNLPNVEFADARTPRDGGWEKDDAVLHTGNLGSGEADWLGGREGLALRQDLSSERRGNMVRRLPKQFRRKVYFAYKKKFGIPASAFEDVLVQSEDELPQGKGFRKAEGGGFEQRVAEQEDLEEVVGKCVRDTVSWPASSQTVKAVFTAGVGRAWKYFGDKRAKGQLEKKKEKEAKDERGGPEAEKKD